MPIRTAFSRPAAPDAVSGWVSAAVRAAADRSATVMVGVVLMTLAVSWGATWLMGGAGAVAPHWFYVPIFLAAARFGAGGAVVTGAIAGIFAGPLMPRDVGEGIAQTTSDWVSRTGFFVGLGALMAILIKGVSSARLELNAVAHREHELVRQKVEFIEGVTHEFRTPLTVITGTVEILSDVELAPSDRRDLVAALRGNVARLSTLVEVLVVAGEGIGADDDGASAVTDLDATLWRWREELPQTLDAPTRLRIASPGRCEVIGDRRLISIALRSVIDNALRHSRDDTLVDCVIEDVGQGVRLVVRDRGPGIDPEVARRALDAPVTNDDPRRPGAGDLGVGLFAVAQVMRRIGGAVDVSPHAEGGTEVILVFRRVPLPARRP